MSEEPAQYKTNNDKEIKDVISEVKKVELRFDGFKSSHDGYAVILEEVDELWNEVKKRSHDYHTEYEEAKQIACTAIRYMKMCRQFNKEVGK